MTGIILMGHGQFADGLYSALTLIAGQQDNFEVVNFDGESVGVLESDIQSAIAKLSHCKHVLILTDITGGSPFQTAAMIAHSQDNMAVIGGTNLGLLVEASMTRTFSDNFEEFVESLVESAKAAIAKFELAVEDLDDDGEIL